MTIDATTAVSATSSTAATQSTTQTSVALEYEAFLSLLVAELEYQDPTEPMDSSEFIAQLADFANVEQSVRMNDKLDTLLTSIAFTQADSLIGKTVTSGDGLISGEVVALRAVTEGSIAILSNGDELLIGNGVTVSA
ncbi:MAG: flagellar hook assembly protein FlgD [Hyphomicrobiales bacterium]|nr:flagellar hook assembly protein FlgD [Hyphomicrobiales bacterium]